MEGLILAWTGLLGACVGSFTNVVAWRLPRQELVVFPVSRCSNAAMPSAGMTSHGARLAVAEGALPRL